MNTVKRTPIYKHTHLKQESVDRVLPLFESAFAEAFTGMTGGRKAIKEERLNFAAKQYANRARIAENMGVNPLNEDAKIFGGMGDGFKQLFESVSAPGNIVGMGGINSPGNPTTTTGGIWGGSYKTGSGDIPSYVFGLQSQVALHCYGFDLLPTISVDTPKVMLNYVDTIYGGGELDSDEYFPTMVEVKSKLFKYDWIKSNGLKRAKTELIIAAGTASAVPAVKVRFMVKSLIDPALNVEVIGVGTYNDATSTFADTATSLTAVIEAVNGALASAKIHLSTDGNDTTVALSAQTPPFSLNYVSSTRTNIAEAATNDNSAGGMSRSQQRKGPKHKLNIVSMDKELHIKGIEIDADTDNIQIKDMAAQGISVIARLYAGVQNQLIQTIDEYILSHLYALGVQHAVNAYEAQGVNHSLYIAAPSNATKTFSDIDVVYNDMEGNDVKGRMGAITNSIQSSAYENQSTHADRLFARILKTSEFCAQQNRIGAVDYAVFSGELASCAKKNSTYTVSPIASTLSGKPELHYTGTIFETISVYKNPRIDFTDPRILLGRRGDDTDPGAKFLAYDLAASRQTIAEGTMAEKIRAWSRFEIADIGFNPELNYYTLVAINEYGWA